MRILKNMVSNFRPLIMFLGFFLYIRDMKRIFLFLIVILFPLCIHSQIYSIQINNGEEYVVLDYYKPVFKIINDDPSNPVISDNNGNILFKVKKDDSSYTLIDNVDSRYKWKFIKEGNLAYLSERAKNKKLLGNIIESNISSSGINFSYEDLNIPSSFSDELIVRDFFDSKSELENIEGIYLVNLQAKNQLKVAVIKDGLQYNMFIMENYADLKDMPESGFRRAYFERMASETIYSIQWLHKEKRYRINTTAIYKNGLVEFSFQGEKLMMIKSYPSSSSQNNRITNKSKKGEWVGNGSGIIISESGYIVTNYHVIDDADEIEVEFILNGELQKLNAEIVQVDKVNDLAILRIFDMNFDGLEDIQYNFKTRSSDVGTKIYAYGYPMALSVMGKEVKITDGIISSKSGFDGDITTYQITAAIQKGNSGGPLFDENGNFIGINSSGIRKDIADNVAYSIKSNYVLNLIDVLPKSIDLPSSNKLESLPLTEQIKEISKYVVLIKVK